MNTTRKNVTKLGCDRFVQNQRCKARGEVGHVGGNSDRNRDATKVEPLQGRAKKDMEGTFASRDGV